MEINLDNPKSIFPREVFKLDGKNLMKLEVKNVKDLDAAKADGWLDQYIHQDFPKLLYHADGRMLKVEDSAAEEAAKKQGFGPAKTNYDPELHVDSETRAHQRSLQQDAILAEKQLATDRALLELLRGKVESGKKGERG